MAVPELDVAIGVLFIFASPSVKVPTMTPALQRVVWTLPVAFGLWAFTFALPQGNFWVKLSISACLLALAGLRWSWDERASLFHVKGRYLWLGPLTAFLLYGIFWLGREVSTFLLPFASGDISRVYLSKAQLHPVAIGLLLLFVIGPAEEIYWHGFVQRALGKKFGATGGLLITTGIYTLVHVSALNAILVAAAAICGLFWGWLYQREQNLIPVILSHSIWDLTIFVIVPLA